MAIITFVYPDYESLGIEYLMAACLSEGHDVHFISYRDNNLFFYRKFFRNIEDVAEQIVKMNSAVAAFSCVTDNYRSQLLVAEALKKLAPHILTIFGGVHVTALPEKVIQNSAVDCVALGEAENSLCEWLRNLIHKSDSLLLPDHPIEGMVFKRDGKLVGSFELAKFQELDNIPFPHKAPVYEQVKSARAEYMVMSGRGCPFSCAYCFNSSSHFSEKKLLLRRRSVGNVIDELIKAKREYFPRSIFFEDDCFTSDPEWLLEFCREYRDEVALPFACFTHPLYVDDRRCEALKSGGCTQVYLGVQSLSATICREVINRKGAKRDVSAAIECLKRHGLMVIVDHMLGIPGDTAEIQEESVLFYNEHRPFIINAFWLCYYPGTAIIRTAHRMGALTDEQIEMVENGNRISDGCYPFLDGDADNPGEYRGIAFILSWLPLIPKPLVRYLIRKGIYKKITLKSYFLSIALPRIILCLHPANYRGRYYLSDWVEEKSERITSYLNFIRNCLKR